MVGMAALPLGGVSHVYCHRDPTQWREAMQTSRWEATEGDVEDEVEDEERDRVRERERTRDVTYQSVMMLHKQAFRLVETKGRAAMIQWERFLKGAVASLAEDYIPTLALNKAERPGVGEVTNPNPGHASRRGSWKRARRASEQRTSKKR